MAGAAHGVLDLTLRHVRERTQFGRPLVKFQAVQHQLSQLAANVVTVDMAADAAVLALLRNDSATELTVAAGKGEASSLARQIAAGGHQAHGAMGFTMEYRLGAFTKRLWSWREEFGNERHWHECVAGLVVSGHGDVWAVLTNTPQ
jgi:acyl-CoA dehydrogenase